MYQPFYFAYVDDDTVAFDPTIHNVMDENIYSFEIKHDEGQVPTMHITIKNPRIGLLNPARKQWAYLSYQHSSGSGIIPLFFGVLVGIPSDFFAELIELQFNARSVDYIALKQAVAETLRNTSNYDPIFLDEAHRDEPDAILEGWSALYHVDRVTLDVSASDILEGEDGNIVFDESMGIYDSVKMTMGECPLNTVQIQANVKWTQRCIGYIDGPSANITSYTGGSFKGDWPKPGATVGGGWKCETSYVNDVLDTEHARTWTMSSNWQNNDPTASDCSVSSMTFTATYSSNPGIAVEGTGARHTQTGICDPFAYASYAATTPGVNIPAKVSTSGTIALEWILNCSWSLRYDAKRDFTELLIMNVTANLQQTLVSPMVDQDTEVIKVSGADVGLPLEVPYAWTDFANSSVSLGQVIFPNDPTTPGGTSYQICVQEGLAGSDEPVFSDVPGTITTDNQVKWASLGESPPSTYPEWTDSTAVGIGQIMVIEPKTFSTTTGDMQTTGASYFFMCIEGGTTNRTYTTFEYIKSAESSDDLPSLPVPFAVILGPGDVAYSNISGGAGLPEQFNGGPLVSPNDDFYDSNLIAGNQGNADNPIVPAPGGNIGVAIPGIGETVVDGSVTWINLGTTPPFLTIPLGGTMTNVTARSYFPTARGQQSIQYLINRARARLRMRARCVTVAWDAPFEDCLGLSCRHNSTLYDPRLPGGVATGKVKSYTLSADKDGKMIGHVEIGCAVGYGGTVSGADGTPEYTAATGYCLPGYQAYDNTKIALSTDDIYYTQPVFAPFDDGLIFPLQFFPGTLTITHPIQSASIAAQLAAQNAPQLSQIPTVWEAVQEFKAGHYAELFKLEHPYQPLQAGSAAAINMLEDLSAIDWLTTGIGQYLIECDPVAAEILIQPVTNGPFNGSYYIDTSLLEIPMGINLGAASSP